MTGVVPGWHQMPICQPKVPRFESNTQKVYKFRALCTVCVAIPVVGFLGIHFDCTVSPKITFEA